MEQQEHDIITRMNEKFMRMSKGHKAIAAYISDHYDQAVFMTAAQLGDTGGVSESTVVRFATGLGYDGYPEFQKALESWVTDKLNTVQKISAKYGNSTQSEILHSVLSADIEKIQAVAGAKFCAQTAILCDYDSEWDGMEDKWHGPLRGQSMDG